MPPFVRKLLIAFLLAQSLATTAWPAPADRPLPDIQASYEPELFELAYSVFMANSSLPEALAVAEKALQTRPLDNAWRTRAAQAAEWSGRPDLALQHWFQLAENGAPEARQAALRLSRALNELPLRKKLLEQSLNRGDQSPDLLKEYLAVAEEQGLPQEAYDLLASGRIRNKGDDLLAKQARLAEMLGCPLDAIAAWDQLALLRPLQPDETLKLATLWHGQGNPDQAWQTMQTGARSAPPAALNFWRSYTDLAWSRQEIGEVTRVSRTLLEQGTAVEIDYQRLIMIYQPNEPQQAYATALLGWQRFRTPLYWYTLAESGLRSGHERELTAFLKGLKAEERKFLAGDARSRMMMAQVHRQSGDISSSLTEARAALRLAPDNGDVVSSYLWLLIDLQQTAELRQLTRDWEWRIIRLPELREPLAAALMLLGNPPRALRLYRILAPERQNDPAWLASYADVLEQAGHPESAWIARRQSQLLLAQRLRKPADSAENARRNLLTKTQLLMHLAPGDALRAAIQRLSAEKQDDFSRGLIMGWAMAGGQTDLARLWNWRALARAGQRLEWASLGLALEENDRTAIADLIESSLERLPYRDAVEGARRSGQTLLAESIAFEQFQIHDRDHLLDKQIRDLYQEHPTRLRARLTLQEQGGVGFLDEVLSLSYPITKRLTLTAELNNTEIRHQRRGILRQYPSSIRGGLLGLQLRHEKGTVRLTGGVTDALYFYPSLELAADWHPYSRLTLDLLLRRGWQATESVPLRIGGLKDEAVIGLTAALTPRDSLSGRLTYRSLRDQKRRSLADSFSVEGEATHRLLIDWPDTNLRFFSGYHHFDRTEAPAGKTGMMIPDSFIDKKGYYVPESFVQVGGGINFGQQYRTVYSRQWLPFGAIDFSWNSVSNAGFRYELGLAGPLFGLDKLEGAFSQESGRFGSSDINTRTDIRYLYNFN